MIERRVGGNRWKAIIMLSRLEGGILRHRCCVVVAVVANFPAADLLIIARGSFFLSPEHGGYLFAPLLLRLLRGDGLISPVADGM